MFADFGILLDTPHLFLRPFYHLGGAKRPLNFRYSPRNRWGVSKSIQKSSNMLDTATEIGREYPKILFFCVFSRDIVICFSSIFSGQCFPYFLLFVLIHPCILLYIHSVFFDFPIFSCVFLVSLAASMFSCPVGFPRNS